MNFPHTHESALASGEIVHLEGAHEKLGNGISAVYAVKELAEWDKLEHALQGCKKLLENVPIRTWEFPPGHEMLYQDNDKKISFHFLNEIRNDNVIRRVLTIYEDD